MARSTESTICVPLPQFCGAPTIRRAILEAQVVNCVLERTAFPASSLEFAQQDVNVFRSRDWLAMVGAASRGCPERNFVVPRCAVHVRGQPCLGRASPMMLTGRAGRCWRA